MGDVDLCGALGDAEYVGDGLRGEALGGELRDLALAGTERLPEARKFADRFGLGRFLASSESPSTKRPAGTSDSKETLALEARIEETTLALICVRSTGVIWRRRFRA